MNKRYSVLLATIFMIVLFSVSAFAAKPKLSKQKVSLNEGKTVTLTLKNANKGKIKWSSSNKKTAAVKSKGKNKAVVTANKKGTAKVTAKFNGKKYTCKVTVKKADTKDSFTWDISTTPLSVVKTGKAVYVPLTTKTRSGKHTIRMAVQDQSVLELRYNSFQYPGDEDYNLTIYPKKVGSTTITLSCEGVVKKISVTVTKDNSEVYQAGMGKYLDSSGNFIPSYCTRLKKEETAFASGNAQRSWPFDGYHIGPYQITLEDVMEKSTAKKLHNDRIGAEMYIDRVAYNRWFRRLKLAIVDESGNKKSIITHDATFSTSIESGNSKMALLNEGYCLTLLHPQTSMPLFGTLHVRYRGLEFELPFGTPAK